MYRLDSFKRKKNPLKYTIPFGRIISCQTSTNADTGVVINKDGSLQVTWRYTGPDLGSSTPDELAAITYRLNNTLMSLESGYTLYLEARRKKSKACREDVYFPDPLTKLMDIERKHFFQNDDHFESDYFCTLCWMPPTEIEDRMEELFVEGKKHVETSFAEVLEKFIKVSDQIMDLFISQSVPSNYLDCDELLSYLHSTVSSDNRNLKMPKKNFLLDQILYDSPLYGGLNPKLGNKHLRIVVPTKFLGYSNFGFFDVLNQLDFEYRWVTRFYCLSKQDCLAELTKVKKQWSAKIKSIKTLIVETISGAPSSKNDNKNAIDKHNEVEDAIHAVENDSFSFGFYSTAILILDEDENAANVKAKIVVNALMNLNLQAKIEGLNAIDAWMGCIPGNTGHNIRRPIIATGNLVHMMPISNIWAGPTGNKHLNGPPLIYTETTGNTPFRLNLHIGDVGHSMMVGMTGGGKSVHLNLIEAQFRKYKNAKVIVFDKGSTSIALTLGVGGDFYDLGAENNAAISFQPMIHADDPNEQQWLLGWLSDFIESQNVKMTPELTKKLFVAIQTVAVYQNPRLRTMTNLMNAVNDDQLKLALQPLTLAGSYGYMFDADYENLSFSSWQTFEMEKLMQMEKIVSSALMYIFHRIEQNLDGSPTLIVLDECWVFLRNAQFAAKIDEWLKVLRKSNACVLFALQEIQTVAESSIFNTINTNCATKIFLPFTMAVTDEIIDVYTKFGLNRTQINILHNAQVKKDYYYVSSQGVRMYDLKLEHCDLAMAYIGINTEDVKKAKEIRLNFPQNEFNNEWLKYKRINLVSREEEQHG